MTPMLLLLLGCRDKPAVDTHTVVEDTAPATAPDPWLALEAVPLEPMRALLSATLEDTVDPRAIRTLPERALAAVIDGPEVVILDPLYHQTSEAFCISASEWPDWGDEERRGSCPKGQVYTRRGRLIPDGATVDAAFDPIKLTLTVLTVNGTVQTADADLLGDNPLDFLRLSEPIDLGLGPLESTARLAVRDGSIAIVTDNTLLLEDTIIDLPGTAAAVAWVDAGVWALTDGGLWADGTVLSVSGTAMAVGTDAVWVGAPGAISRVDRESLAVESITLDGATGAVAVDGDKTYAATGDGIAVLQDGAEIARYTLDAPVDLGVGPPHEILALVGGEVRVFLDETALVGDDVLDVVMTTFIEKPRNEGSDTECRGGGETITGYAEQAATNTPMLEDLPLPPVVGITPFFAKRAAECDLLETLSPLLSQSDVGILYHSLVPEDCETDCLVDWLTSEAAQVIALGVEPSWASGLAAKDDLPDFADLLRQADGPDRYLFFGISSLPDLTHEADPRAKNSWPIQTGQRSPAWRIDHAEELVAGAAGGWLTVYPGDNIPLFNLGGCPNLLLRECHQVGLGGTSTIDAADTLALTLMLHRALADRDGPSTFTFHLPDLGVYDYTTDCTVTDRVWSGEGCQAAILQQWAFETWQRYALGGLARMSGPADLPRPE